MAVDQDDLLYGYLTVTETLLLAAHFMLAPSTPYADKVKLVHGIIKVGGADSSTCLCCV